MPNSTEGLLLLVGAAFFLIGLIGGGVKISELEVPATGKYARLFSMILGGTFMSIAIFRLLIPSSSGPAIQPTITSVAINTQVPTTVDVPPTTVAISTPTDQEYLSVSSTWNQVYLDTFDNNQGNWRYIDNTESPSVTYDFGGNFFLNIDARQSSLRKAFYREAGNPLPETFSLSVDAALDQQTGCDYGLIVGDIDRERYVFAIVGDKKNYKVTRVLYRGGNEDKVDLIPSTPIPANTDLSRLAVVRVQNNFLFYIGDSFIARISDTQVKTNKAGLEVFVCKGREAKYAFDNFELRQPNSN